MKHIKKKQEPQTLTDKRNTNGSIYDGPQKDWQDALLEEQGHICAYCMRRISLDRKNGKPCIEIEHYLSRNLHPKLDLIWENMIGVCNGDTVPLSEGHCDKTKGKYDYKGVFVQGKANGKVKLNILNPLEINKSEKIITYSSFGDVLPNVNDNELQNRIIEDVNCILNLNNEKLREYRAEAIASAKRNLVKKYPTGNWTIKQFDDEIEIWKRKDNDGKYKPFCQAAIWWLEKKRAKITRKS